MIPRCVVKVMKEEDEKTFDVCGANGTTTPRTTPRVS